LGGTLPNLGSTHRNLFRIAQSRGHFMVNSSEQVGAWAPAKSAVAIGERDSQVDFLDVDIGQVGFLDVDVDPQDLYG